MDRRTFNSNNIPEALKKFPNWALWMYSGSNKKKKIPINAGAGIYAKSNDSSTWSSYSVALDAFIAKKWIKKHKIQGMQFALSEDTNLVCVDCDNQVVDGKISEFGQSIIDEFPDTYIEWSPSGTGFHIWLKGELPANSRNRKGDVEVYENKRFMNVTGNPMQNKPIMDCQDSLNWLIENHVGFKKDNSRIKSNRVVVSSDKIKERIEEIGKYEFYQALFQDGNWDAYYGSQSEADLGLMNFLARITKGDADKMKQVFSKSALGQRDKWRKRNDYQDRTIKKALDGYTSKSSFDPNVEFDGEKYISKLPLFPVEVFPEPFAKIVREVSDSFSNLPIEIPGVSLLSVTGALIGQTKKIQPKAGWTESANCFFIIVAASGEGKSPAMKTILQPIYQWDVEKQKEFENEMVEYEMSSESNSLILAPTRKRLLINDTTPEALVKVFSENPRGLLWYSDEIIGLILNLDRYSGGNSKHLLMSCYDGSPIYVDRKVEGTTYIPNPCLSMLGSVQPDVLPEVFKQADAVNGLLARTTFVFSSREQPDVWSELVVSEESNEFLSMYVNETLDDENSEVVKLTGDAKSIFVDWVNQRAQTIHLCSKDKQRSVFNKEKSKALKLILILHHMDCFAEKKPFVSPISPNVVRNALLLTDYFNDHQIQVWRFFEKTRPIHLNPFDKQVAKEVIKFSSEDKIYPGKVAEIINSKPKTVASAFARIEMVKGSRDKSGTPYFIPKTALDQLKEVLC